MKTKLNNQTPKQPTGPNAHKPTSSNSKQTIAIIAAAVVVVVLAVFLIGSFVSQPKGDTVVTVNGTNITIVDPSALLEAPTGINKVSDKIDLALLSARYKNVNTSSVGTTIDSFKSTYGDKYLETAEQIIGYPVSNEQDVRDYLTLSLYTEELFAEFVPVTDAQIQEKYEANYRDEVCARHILIEDEAAAQSVLDAIAAGEYTVEEVVADKTIVGDDVEIKEASDLSCFGKGRMVAEFETAVFAMAKDTTSTELVETSFGFHIINAYDIKTVELTDELTATITSALISSEKTLANYQTFMAEIRKDAMIDFINEDVKTAYDELQLKLTTEE